MVGAGFIAFTILNAILSRGAFLTIVEVAPRILPRMVDAACAEIVAGWLTKNGVILRTGATLTGIEESRGKRKLSFAQGDPIAADVVIMATGIRANLEWLDGSDIARSAEPGGGIVVDDHLRSSAATRLCRRRRGARRESPDRACPRSTPSSRRRRSTGGWWAPTWPGATSPIAAAS